MAISLPQGSGQKLLQRLPQENLDECNDFVQAGLKIMAESYKVN